MGGERGIFEPQEFFSLSNSLHDFFRPWHEYFLGLIGAQEFFSFNFLPARIFFWYFARPPISFLMVRPLLQKTGALFILINEFCNRGRDRK